MRRAGSAGGAAPAAMFKAERRDLLMREAQAKARAHEGALEAGLEETRRLATARGEALQGGERRLGEGRRPMRRVTGLQWLLSKGRISPVQALAGERYGGLCDRAVRGDLGSSLRERVGGAPALTLGEAKMAALMARDRADWVLREGLPEAPGRDLVRLCRTVCFDAATVREAAGGDRVAAERMEVQLGMCLNRLAVHFGLVPPGRP